MQLVTEEFLVLTLEIDGLAARDVGRTVGPALALG